MSGSPSPFLFACCREGSETSLKNDVLRRHGTLLTPAFMRPQFITWKVRSPIDESFDLASPFARVSGLSLGQCKTGEEMATRLIERSLRRVCLHVFPRVVPEDADIDWQSLDSIRNHIASVLQNHGIKLDEGAEHVLNLVVDDNPNALFFAGLRKRRAEDPQTPGGLPCLSIPGHAPSRAWLKVEQALGWRGWDKLDLRGLSALDLGCAPGGASLALLDRGMKVIGVDTGDMDEVVLRHDAGGFRHLRMPLSRLNATKLPSAFALLLCDINLAPPEVLPHIARICDSIQVERLILTLKMNQPIFEKRLDEFVNFIRSFAPSPVVATQLAANRKEVCVMAGR